MKETWRERFIFWFCDTFGHKLKNNGWDHNGMFHVDCVRCGRVVSIPKENER